MPTVRIKKHKPRAVVLFSGGLDSAVTLALALEDGWDPYPLCFDYGQSNRVEIEYARRLVSDHFRLPRPLNVMKLDYAAIAPQCAMLGGPGAMDSMEATNVPNRTMVFLSIAAAYAESLHAKSIWIGTQTEWDPKAGRSRDTKSNLIDLIVDTARYMRRHVDVGSGNLELFSPLFYSGKAEILRMAQARGIRLDTVRTCLASDLVPCEACISCLGMRKRTGLVC